MIDVNQQPISVVGGGPGNCACYSIGIFWCPCQVVGAYSDVVADAYQRENTVISAQLPDSLSVYTDMAECLAGVNDVLLRSVMLCDITPTQIVC